MKVILTVTKDGNDVNITVELEFLDHIIGALLQLGHQAFKITPILK